MTHLAGGGDPPAEDGVDEDPAGEEAEQAPPLHPAQLPDAAAAVQHGPEPEVLRHQWDVRMFTVDHRIYLGLTAVRALGHRDVVRAGRALGPGQRGLQHLTSVQAREAACSFVSGPGSTVPVETKHSEINIPTRGGEGET